MTVDCVCAVLMTYHTYLLFYRCAALLTGTVQTHTVTQICLVLTQSPAWSSWRLSALMVSVWCEVKIKKRTLLMSKRFLPLPACTVHAHALQEVISCCCFHFAFSRWMFYSFPGMLIKLMKGGMGIELIMFYGSKTQWGLCFFAPVFFSQLAEWLTLPGGCCAPAADGDQY